jgi:alkylation response protein AidB-like acyl-CoA dehydrogenase
MMSTDQHGISDLLRDSAERFLAAHHTTARARQIRGASSGFDRKLWARIAEQGWLSLRLPDAYGGADLDLESAVVIAEAFGARLAPDPYIGFALMPGALLASLPFGAGSQTTAVAWQNRMGQLAPVADDLLGQRDHLGIRLRGRRMFVQAGSDRLLVAAVLDGVPCIVVVAATADGLHWEEMRMADGSDIGHVTFDDAAGYILHSGPDAIAAIEVAVREATIATAALLTSLASKALAETIGYMKQRKQFDQALVDFQANRHRLVDLQMQIKLSGASWRRALLQYAKAPLSDLAAAAVSAAKARASDTALLVARAAVQFHGAFGYTEEADIGLYLRSALRHATSFGNSSAHRARHLSFAGPKVAT